MHYALHSPDSLCARPYTRSGAVLARCSSFLKDPGADAAVLATF
jgi:hypothetical protein